MPTPTVRKSGAPTATGSGAAHSSSKDSVARGVSTPGISRPSGIGDCVFIEKARKQSIGMIYGGTGGGKTTILTRYAPEPLMLINFDGRARAAAEEAAQLGRTVHFVEIPFDADNLADLSPDQAKEQAKQAFRAFSYNYKAGLGAAMQGKLKTIVFDTGTELGDMIQIAFRGAVGVKGEDYGNSKNQISIQWWNLYHAVRRTPANLIVLSRQRAVYVDHQETDRFKPKIQDTAEEGVDWIAGVQLNRKGNAYNLQLNVYNAKTNKPATGDIYKPKDWMPYDPLSFLHSKMYPNSEREDWNPIEIEEE